MIEDVTPPPPLAFPSQPLGMDGLPDHWAAPGMTLRDWFAGQALQAIIQADGAQFFGSAGVHAKTAYEHADAMLAQLRDRYA